MCETICRNVSKFTECFIFDVGSFVLGGISSHDTETVSVHRARIGRCMVTRYVTEVNVGYFTISFLLLEFLILRQSFVFNFRSVNYSGR